MREEIATRVSHFLSIETVGDRRLEPLNQSEADLSQLAIEQRFEQRSGTGTVLFALCFTIFVAEHRKHAGLINAFTHCQKHVEQ